MFEVPEDFYQAIGQELAEIIPEPWTSVEVTVERFEDSIDIGVVYFTPDGTRKSKVSVRMLPDYFYDLAKVISTKEKGYYRTCQFSMNTDGAYDVNFQYS